MRSDVDLVYLISGISIKTTVSRPILKLNVDVKYTVGKNLLIMIQVIFET